MNCQDKSIELTNKFPELIGSRREDVCAAFSKAIEWGRKDAEVVDLSTKTILSAPSTHSLQQCFAELKFGRPAADQHFLDDCVEQLNNNKKMKRTLDESINA